MICKDLNKREGRKYISFNSKTTKLEKGMCVYVDSGPLSMTGYRNE